MYKRQLEVLQQKKNRIILIRKDCKTCPMQFRSLLNGVLMQEKDLSIQGKADLEPMTDKQPTASEVEDLLFANKIVKNSKSNAITLVTVSYTHLKTLCDRWKGLAFHRILHDGGGGLG